MTCLQKKDQSHKKIGPMADVPQQIKILTYCNNIYLTRANSPKGGDAKPTDLKAGAMVAGLPEVILGVYFKCTFKVSELVTCLSGRF